MGINKGFFNIEKTYQADRIKTIDSKRYWMWYFNPKIKFKIIQYTRNRETALLGWSRSKQRQVPLRMLKIHSVQHIDFHLKAINWSKVRWNMYYSLAEYKNGIPNQKFNLAARDHTEWNENHYKEMIGYDYLIDIDATDHFEMEHAKRSALNVASLLMDHDIPHEIRFSGCGFHIVVPYYYFAPFNRSFEHGNKDSIYYMYSLISRKLNKEMSEMIDIKINDARRLCKLPYSLALYNNKMFVCMPLSMEKLKNFELYDYTPNEVLKCLE